MKNNQKKGRGRIYLVLILLVTLVLAADVANRMIPGETGLQTEPLQGFQMPEGFQIPEGEDFTPGQRGEIPSGRGGNREQGEQGSFGGRMPNQGDSAGEMPSPGEFGSEMPSPEISGTDALQQGVSLAGVQTLARSYWIPILAVCLLGDGVLLLLYIRCRRRMREETAEEEQEPEETEIRRKKSRIWVVPVCFAVIAAMVVKFFPSSQETVEDVTVTQSVLSGTAAEATIYSKLSGAGTLAAQEVETVAIPDGVKLVSYHVQNGDGVEAGAILATVDSVSVASAIVELQTVLEELDSDLQTQASKTEETVISATVGGRVKAIYAQPGDNVSDTVYRYGALMLLSLDGLMEVEIPAWEQTQIGDPVTVLFRDGTEETGRVAQLREGMAVVTLSDVSAELDSAVVVADSQGQTLGEGTLAVHSPWKVMGYYGSVDTVPVSVNQKVTAGTTLLRLTQTGHTQTYRNLLELRGVLEERMETLFRLYREGVVRADSPGIVTGVPTDAQITPLAANQGKITRGSTLAAQEGVKLMLLSAVDTDGLTQQDQSDAAEQEDLPEQTNEPATEPAQSESATEPATEPTQSEPATEPATEPTQSESATEPATEPTQSESATEPATEPTQPEEGEPTTDPSAPTQPEETLHTGYVARITKLSGTTVELLQYSQPVFVSDYNKLSALAGLDMTVKTSIAYGAVRILRVNGTEASYSELSEGDLLFFEDTGDVIWVAGAGTSQGSRPSGGTSAPSAIQGGSAGGIGSGGNSFGGGQSSQSSTPLYEQYSTGETTVLSLYSAEQMQIEILIDELDILSVEIGLEAQVTLDAMTGRSFTGTVTKIARTGTNSGGNTKYAVQITLPREEKMLAGMNASVLLVTDVTLAQIAIPVAALVEEDGRTYVYTRYLEGEDVLEGLVEVETGAADAETVEILSGLNPGDSYYYRYADGLVYHFTASL